MARIYRSEIRDTAIRDLLAKVKRLNYGQYLRKIKLQNVRAFHGEEVSFDFPVTALIGTNGGGKSTILGGAAIAYKAIKPALFFPKSSIGDSTMANWSIAYELIDRTINQTQLIQRSARFKNLKWARDDLVDRPVLYFGIQRTVPAGERKEFKKYASQRFKYSGVMSELGQTVRDQVAKILGKDVSRFQSADVSSSNKLYIGGDGRVQYSEFHFGAGESSVIRMVSEIEVAPENSIVLIEEIENGLHPVATRRMVEYLIDVAERKSIQSIFTTHSEEALAPLPPEGIWSSIDGKTQQGRISIEALRTITGRVNERLAVFTEDRLAKEWVESIIRTSMPARMDEIGVYALSGDSRAENIHRFHMQNPSLQGKLASVCIVDGDSKVKDNEFEGILRLPGGAPESEIFNYTRNNIESLAMKLSVALHLPTSKDQHVRSVVEEVSNTNRDHHLLFNQVGMKAGLISENIVVSAFIAIWNEAHQDQVDRVANFIAKAIGKQN